MSKKDLTGFARQARKIAIAAFVHPMPKNSIPRCLQVRTGALLTNLRGKGYPKAFAYAEHYNGEITVTFDMSPARGDGWAIVFALDESRNRQFYTLRERRTVHVPDLEATS